VKLDGSTQDSRSAPQRIPLRPCPGSPLDNYIVTESKEILSQFPLKFFDSRASFFLPKADLQGVHPFVGTEAHGAQVLLNLLGVRGLARARQATNDDESCTNWEFAHLPTKCPTSFSFSSQTYSINCVSV